LKDGWDVRAVTRNPEGDASRALAAQGAEIAQADMTDRASLDRALEGAYGAFGVQNTWTAGLDGEILQGKVLAEAVKAAGVQHFIYTSVGGAERNSGVPHFDSKWEIEQHIQALGVPATVLRPVFFMENLLPYAMGPRDGVLSMGQPADVPLQMVAVDDIGAFAALAFAHPDQYVGKSLEIAGDSLTLPDAAKVLSEVSGQPIQYAPQPIEQVRAYSEDLAAMFDWFVQHGYEADIATLRRIYPALQDFRSWAQQYAAAYN
jgi:uncharacterized protein YbjT (DUF2867 family)